MPSWSDIRNAMPTGLAQWKVAFWLAIGALIGWALTPSLWLVAGPRCWLVLVLSRAAQESAWRPEAMGRAGEFGVMQFTELGALYAGWRVDPNDDWRGSPFWSGWAAARHTRQRLSQAARWWLLAIPVYRWAVFARSWRYGPDMNLSGAWTEAREERAYWPAYWGWSALTLGPVVLALLYYGSED